jgi:MoxR-like ATPase
MKTADVQRTCEKLLDEVERAIVGKRETLELVLLGFLANGNVLLEDVPGLAKTLMARSFAETIGLRFARVQFTPDLMPADITGSSVLDQRSGQFEFRRGPIFSNLLLADEINRSPAKTQAALLEAMQELQVTVGGKRHALQHPFFVLATQNPIEQEGTYPLPEAQLDRFMYMIKVGYPTEQEELEIMKLTTTIFEHKLSTVLTGEEILKLQDVVRRVPVADHVIRYAMALSRATRVSEGGVPDFVKEWVHWGAGPRASQYLIIGAKAHAVLQGRYYVTVADVKAIAHPVLRHRVVTNFTAEAEGVTSDKIVDKLLEVIPAKEASLEKDPALPKVTGA